VLGRISSAEYNLWNARVPNSVGPAKVIIQPKNLTRFDDAAVTWVGGDNWTDDPTVTVQRKVDGAWQAYADQSGQIQVVLNQRAALTTAALNELTDQQRWTWTASMEAFDSFPRADVPGGQVPNGQYRFVINGDIHTAGKMRAYHLESRVFRVRPWRGITISHLQVKGHQASFTVAPIRYPRLPIHIPSALKGFYKDNGGGTGKPNTSVLCETCSFMPWASHGRLAAAVIEIVDRGGDVVRTVPAHQLDGSTWGARVTVPTGAHLVVPAGGVRDTYGETNARRLSTA
jgi:hypothetical protein